MSLPAQVKLEAVLAILKDGKTVSFVAREYKVARKTLYSWIARYKNTNFKKKVKALENRYVSGSLHPRAISPKVEFILKRLIVVRPAWGCRRYSLELKKRGYDLGYFGVNSLLKRLGAETPEFRENFRRGYSGPGRLNTTIKLEIVKKCLGGESVSTLSKRYQVARKTIYKWITNYHLASKKGIVGALALSESYVKAEAHPRAVYPKITQKLLSLVAENPALSVHKLTKYVPASSWTVWKILDRNNLNSKVARLAYAETLRGREVSFPARISDRIKLVWEEFIPSLAPAPPPLPREALAKWSKPFLISSSLSFLISFGLVYWIRLLGGTSSFGSAIGIILATVALGMGSLFFLYSLKYYITLAIVLSFSQTEAISRRPGGASGTEGKKKGLLSWLLGHANGGENGKSRPIGLEPLRAGGPMGLEANLEHVVLKRHPFISVHIPLYNEKNVVERIIAASTNFQYQGDYEVILCDDSSDETTEIIRKYQRSFGKLRTSLGDGYTLTVCEVRPGVILKHLHRTSRSGFKGGALRLALSVCDARTEFVSVFDADFVPYPDTLELFLKYFQVTAGTLDFSRVHANKATNENSANVSESINTIRMNSQNSNSHSISNIAAVQGYQWHVLNKSENWITRGVRSEYAGSYVIERSGTEIYSGLKQISGSVYMVRRDVLDEVGWETSITEDFQLTLKLYEAGYKVVYTPYIQAPAECVSTIKRLIRQRMRWAEGHSNNIRRMFMRLMFGKWEVGNGNEKSSLSLQSEANPASHFAPHTSRKWIPSPLTLSEKLEFLYLSPYYLQAFFFLLGTLSWLISETIFTARLPFWTSLWGWSLVLTNMLSLPLMNAVGLFLEESEERDYTGLFSFVVLSYILVPFQAYAAIKGFLERQEGPWFRTPKTGRITDIFTRGRFYRFISGILPGRTPAVAQRLAALSNVPAAFDAAYNGERLGNFSLNAKPYTLNPYLSLSTANSRFDNFKIHPRHIRWLGKFALVFVLILSMLLSYFSFNVPLVEASPGTQIKTVEFMISQYNSGTDIVRGDGVAATDYSDDVGQYNSIALGSDGFARIATYDADGGDLRYIACSNASCTTQSVNLDVDTSNNVGQYTSMFLASDLPTISYYDVTATALKLARCTGDGADAGSTACDATGEWTLTTVDNATSANTGQYTSIAGASDTFPRIAYYDVTNGNQLFVQCDDVDCSASGETITTVEATDDVGKYASLALDSSDNAMISYYLDGASDDLRYVLCTNNSCSTVDADTPRTLYSTGTSGLYTSIAKGSDGFPRISFYGDGAATTLDLLFIQCGTADCVTVTATTEVETTSDVGQFSSLVLNSSDLGRIAYFDNTNANVRYVECINAACSTFAAGTPAALDGGTGASGAGNVGTFIDATWKSSDDTVMIVYYDSENKYVMFIQCTNTACADSNRNMTIPDVGTAATGNDVSVTINLPESSITVRKAIVEWRTIHAGIPNNRTSMAAEMRFYRSDQTPTVYKMGRRTLASTQDGSSDEAQIFVATAENTPMVFRMEVGSQIASGSNTYSFNATMWGPSARNTDSAKIYITYEYDDSSATQLKTVRYFAGQSTTVDTSNVDTTINPNITEGGVSISQHWFEITGVPDFSTSATDVTVNAGFATGSCGAPTTAARGVVDGVGRTDFDYLVLFDASATTPTLNGNNCIRLSVSGNSAALKAAEWVITYSYSYYSQAEGDDTTHVKTVRYFVGQTSGDFATSQTTIASIAFNLPETTISFKSAYVKYWMTEDADGTLTPEICEGASPCTTGSSHTYSFFQEQDSGATLLFDVTSFFTSNWANGDSFNIRAASGTANTIEDVGAEVIINYTYDANATTTGIKTVYWWVGQQAVRSTANFTQASSDSTGDLFDTYLPETGTKTLRSAGVIGNFLNDSISTTAKLPDVRIDSAETGTSETAASFLLTAEANSILIIHNDFTVANKQMTNASQTGIDFTLCPPSNTSGCSGTSPVSSNRSAFAYSTYESSVPAAPELLSNFFFLAPFLPLIIRQVVLIRRRRLDYA